MPRLLVTFVFCLGFFVVIASTSCVPVFVFNNQLATPLGLLFELSCPPHSDSVRQRRRPEVTFFLPLPFGEF